MEESEQKTEFKISDRRRFTAEGSGKSQEEVTPETKTEEPAKEQPMEAAREIPKQPPKPIDFLTFVISLANTALFQLGLIKLPEGESKTDLTGARQTIDILAMMEEKTRGNLTAEEQKALSETLFQLRMAFVEVTKMDNIHL